METDIDKIVEENAKKLIESCNNSQSAVPLGEQAKQYVDVAATKKAVEDEKLVDEITKRKKGELLSSADAHFKQEEAESKKADIKLQEANYGVYDGVATYAGIKKPLPQKMQKVLFSILSFVQTILLVIIGVPVSIINILADCVDSIVKKLSDVTRSARWIVFVSILVSFAVLGFFVIRNLLLQFGII